MNLSGFVHAQRASFLSFSLWEVEVVDKNIVRSGSLSSLQHAQQAFVSAARILWWIKAHLPLLWSVKGTWRLADWTYNGRYLLFHDCQKKSLWGFCPHFTQMPLQTSSHQTHLKVHLLACSDPFTWKHMVFIREWSPLRYETCDGWKLQEEVDLVLRLFCQTYFQPVVCFLPFGFAEIDLQTQSHYSLLCRAAECRMNRGYCM